MNIKSLVDPEGGIIDRRIFADRELYELERERVFARCWLYLGHEREIPRPGDFVTRYMGEEGVKAEAPQSWIVDPENAIIRLTPARIYTW